jgi:hypothetical protein
MATFLELAKQREARKLAMAGLKPDGTPMDDTASRGGGNGGNVDDEGGDEGDEGEDEGDEGGGEGGGDSTAQEIEQLRRDLAAMQGRIAPVQRDVEDYRQRFTTEREAREREVRERDEQIALLRKELESAATPLSPADLLTEDELKDIDPRLAELVVKLADQIAQKRAPKINARAEALQVLEEREKTRVTEHRQKVLTDPARGLHQLGQLAYDPKFIAWSQEEDNDVERVVNSLLNAKSTEEIDRYAKIVAKRIAKFKDSSKGTRQPTDPKASLGEHMRRGDKPRLSQQEINKKLAQAKSLARSSSPADRKRAQAILSEIS